MPSANGVLRVVVPTLMTHPSPFTAAVLWSSLRCASLGHLARAWHEQLRPNAALLLRVLRYFAHAFICARSQAAPLWPKAYHELHRVLVCIPGCCSATTSESAGTHRAHAAIWASATRNDATATTGASPSDAATSGYAAHAHATGRLSAGDAPAANATRRPQAWRAANADAAVRHARHAATASRRNAAPGLSTTTTMS